MSGWWPIVDCDGRIAAAATASVFSMKCLRILPATDYTLSSYASIAAAKAE